jgi:cytochrome c5
MFMMVLGALLAFTVIIIIMANVVGSGVDAEKAADPMKAAAVAKRIEPLAQVNVGGSSTAAPAAPAAPRSGKEVFSTVCSACHSTGAAGAPKVGDKAAWAPRAAKGIDALLQSAENGKGAMPPRGGNPSVTNDELRATIEYMLKETGL